MTRQVWAFCLGPSPRCCISRDGDCRRRVVAAGRSAGQGRREIGRRIEVTCRNNLMVLDLEKDFLPPFRKKGTGRRLHRAGQDHRRRRAMAALPGDPAVVGAKRGWSPRDRLHRSRTDTWGSCGRRPECSRSGTSTRWATDLRATSDYGSSREDVAGGRPQLADYLIDLGPRPGRKPGGGSITVHMP